MQLKPPSEFVTEVRFEQGTFQITVYSFNHYVREWLSWQARVHDLVDFVAFDSFICLFIKIFAPYFTSWLNMTHKKLKYYKLKPNIK